LRRRECHAKRREHVIAYVGSEKKKKKPFCSSVLAALVLHVFDTSHKVGNKLQAGEGYRFSS